MNIINLLLACLTFGAAKSRPGQANAKRSALRFFRPGSEGIELPDRITPSSFGKGDWVWSLPAAESAVGVSTAQSFLDFEKSKGMQWITVKAGDGNSTWGQFNADLVTRAHADGLKVYAWVYSYGGVNNAGQINSSTISGEIAVAKNALATGADGLIIDAETEYEQLGAAAATNAATQYSQGIRASYPNTFLAYSSFPIISLHQSFPFVAFGKYCDAAMPQDYWAAIGTDPASMVSRMDSEWRNAQNSWATSGHGDSIKPIIPVGQGYGSVTGSQIVQFVNVLNNDPNPATAGGYQGVSFWSAQHHTTDMWNALATVSIGQSGPSNDNFSNRAIISSGGGTATGSNTAATQESGEPNPAGVSGTHSVWWSWQAPASGTATISTAGSSFDTTLGVYIGSAVSSLTRIADNDDANGTVQSQVSFAASAGTTYQIEVNGYSSSTGAISLNVSQSAAPPTAPSNVKASALSSTQVGVSWQDNSNNEQGFRVYRWTGSWSLVGVVGANVRSFTESNLQPSSTYYYTVTAYNNGGEAWATNYATVTTLSNISPPSAPSSITASALSSAQVSVSWQDNSSNEQGFRVYRWTGSWTLVGTVGANTRSFTDSYLQPSTTYYYTVTAYNSAGETWASSYATVTTLANLSPPPAASNLIWHTTSTTSGYLTWADNSTNESGFRMQYWSGSSWVTFETAAANATSSLTYTLQRGYYRRVAQPTPVPKAQRKPVDRSLSWLLQLEQMRTRTPLWN